MKSISARSMISVFNLLLSLSFPALGMSRDIPSGTATNSTAPRVAAHSDNCAICLEKLNTGQETSAKLPCNHAFHIACITDCIKQFRLASPQQMKEFPCPLCRGTVPVEQLADLNEEISRTDIVTYLGAAFSTRVTQETLDTIFTFVRVILAHPAMLDLLQEAFQYKLEDAVELLAVLSEHGKPKDLNELKSHDYIKRLRELFPALTNAALADLVYIILHHLVFAEQVLNGFIISAANDDEGGHQLLNNHLEYIPALRQLFSVCRPEGTIDESNLLIKALKNCDRRKFLTGALRIVGYAVIPFLQVVLERIVGGDENELDFWKQLYVNCIKSRYSKDEIKEIIQDLLETDAAIADNSSTDSIESINALLYPFFDGSIDYNEFFSRLRLLPRYDRGFQVLLYKAIRSFFKDMQKEAQKQIRVFQKQKKEASGMLAATESCNKNNYNDDSDEMAAEDSSVDEINEDSESDNDEINDKSLSDSSVDENDENNESDSDENDDRRLSDSSKSDYDSDSDERGMLHAVLKYIDLRGVLIKFFNGISG